MAEPSRKRLRLMPPGGFSQAPPTYSQTNRMPWRPNTRRLGKSRRLRRRLQLGIGFPPKFFAKLVYADFDRLFEFTATATPVVETWRLNSLYDPDYQMGGGQPQYFDSLAGADGGTAPYKTYTVFGCKTEVTVVSTNGAPANIVCVPRVSGTATTTIEDAVMQPGAVAKKLSFYTGGPAVQKITMYHSIAKMWGKSKGAIMDDDNFSAAYNANPANVSYLDVMIAPVATTTSNYYMSIKMTFLSRFSDRTTAAAS